MTEYKELTYRQLKAGQEIKGVKYRNGHSSFSGFVKEVNPGYVTVEMWSVGGREERISSEEIFLVEMSDEEIRHKYNGKAKEAIEHIQKRLHRDEIGYHEMCNSWLSSNPWELAQECCQKKLTIQGHCKDIVPKTAMFSGDVLDVGICVEDDDGYRFWCHFRFSDIEVLVRRYEKYQRWLRDHREEDDIDLALSEVPWELAEEKANKVTEKNE